MAVPWALAALVLIAGTTLFWMAGGIWFDLTETNASAGPWPWLTGGGILIALAGLCLLLFLASNALIRRERASILPTTISRRIE